MPVKFAAPNLTGRIAFDPSTIPVVAIVGDKCPLLILAWILGQVNAKILGIQVGRIGAAPGYGKGCGKGARVADKTAQAVGTVLVSLTISFTKTALASGISTALSRKVEGWLWVFLGRGWRDDNDWVGRWRHRIGSNAKVSPKPLSGIGAAPRHWCTTGCIVASSSLETHETTLTVRILVAMAFASIAFATQIAASYSTVREWLQDNHPKAHKRGATTNG